MKKRSETRWALIVFIRSSSRREIISPFGGGGGGEDEGAASLIKTKKNGEQYYFLDNFPWIGDLVLISKRTRQPIKKKGNFD